MLQSLMLRISLFFGHQGRPSHVSIFSWECTIQSKGNDSIMFQDGKQVTDQSSDPAEEVDVDQNIWTLTLLTYSPPSSILSFPISVFVT